MISNLLSKETDSHNFQIFQIFVKNCFRSLNYRYCVTETLIFGQYFSSEILALHNKQALGTSIDTKKDKFNNMFYSFYISQSLIHDRKKYQLKYALKHK